MDLAKRLKKIVTDNQGVVLFVRIAQPPTGFIVITKTRSVVQSGMTEDQRTEFIRNYLVEFMVNIPDGYAAYRRSGRLVVGMITYFPDQPTAETFAQTNDVAWIYDLATNTAIQVGDFQPNLPGDGVTEV